MRQRILFGLAVLALGTYVPSAAAYAFRIEGETWAYGFVEKNAYFIQDENYRWLELMARVKGTFELGTHTVIESRLVGVSTLGEDYYSFGIDSWQTKRFDGRPDLLSLNLERIYKGQLTLKFGRQEIMLGEGFLIGDGIDDYEINLSKQVELVFGGEDNGLGAAGQYMIPYKYWDGGRATIEKGPLVIDAMVARLNPSVLYSHEFTPILPGHVAAIDWSWSTTAADIGATLVKRRIGDDALSFGWYPSKLRAVSIRASNNVLPLEISGEALVEFGLASIDAGPTEIATRAVGARLNVKKLSEMNPFSPYVKASGFFFSGDDPVTDINEAYDPLFYDWIDFGEWYVGNIGSAQNFENTDSIVAELSVGFQPTPLQSARLMANYRMSHTGTYLGADPLAPMAWEVNAIWDWYPTQVGPWKPEGNWYFGTLLGASGPLKGMQDLGYSATSLELMIFSTLKI